MDVIDLLTGDHNQARGLFSRYEEAVAKESKGDAAALARAIIAALERHMAAEEEAFYRPAHQLSGEIGTDVDEGTEEHHVARLLVDEIKDLEPGIDTWVAKLTVLRESVEHHMDEEEETLFPEVRKATDAPWRHERGAAFEQASVRLGATPLEQRLAMSKTELEALARDQTIPGRSTMTHDELAASVDPS